MKLIKWNFWIVKEHNNFSCLWKFELHIRDSFGGILFEIPQNLQRMYELINVLPPGNFAVLNCCYTYFLCYWLQRAETCTNCINSPALLIFAPNWYKWLHLLWVNWYANEQKCKQWCNDESTYTLLGGTYLSSPHMGVPSLGMDSTTSKGPCHEGNCFFSVLPMHKKLL